jgi:AcrR family transcriptional regulator
MLASEGARQSEIVAAARRLLEEAGPEALTMRALGEAVGMRAPSLYKHFPDKAAVELALVDLGLRDLGDALDAALAAFAEPMAAFAAAYRAWATAHPHLYRLVTGRRAGHAPAGRVERAASLAQRLLGVAGGDAARARALWGLCHGLALLETGGRFPRGAAAAAAWRSAATPLSQASIGVAPAGDDAAEAEQREDPTWKRSTQ